MKIPEWELRGKIYYRNISGHEQMIRTVPNIGWGLFQREEGDDKWEQMGIYLSPKVAKDVAG